MSLTFFFSFWDSAEAACNISKYLNCVPHCINSKFLSAPHECFTKVTWRKHTYSRFLFSTLIYIEQSFWSYQLFDLGSYNQGVSYKKERKGCTLRKTFKRTALRTWRLRVWPPHFSTAWGLWARPEESLPSEMGKHNLAPAQLSHFPGNYCSLHW